MNRGRVITTVRRRQKAGFSMAEVLIVVAILAILSGFVGVNAVRMYRNMKQTQLDKTAETIFHAAQDRLSELYAYGREGTVEDGHLVDSVPDAEKKKVLYITSDDTGKKAYEAIMGNSTVSDDILNNSWVIEYQASTCRVLNVVYSDKSGEGLGGFGRGINPVTSLDYMVADLKLHKFIDRKDKYGWFGDDRLTDLQPSDKQVGTTSVDVEIINEENLYAHIRVSVGWEDDLKNKTEVSDFLKHQKVILTIMDADNASLSPASKSFEIAGEKLLAKGTIDSDSMGFYNGKSDGDDDREAYITNKYLSASWDMLLDSLSENAFTGSNSLKTFEGYSTGITSGNNFYLIAKIESDNGSTPDVQDYDIDNSKFAAYSASTGKAYIEYGRHLQNAGRAQLANFNALQIADIDFNAEASFTRDSNLDEFNKYWLSVYHDDADGYTAYKPYNSAYLDSYDGQNHVIKNLDINKVAEGSTNSGIFGNLSSCVSIKNVIIRDSKVKADGASAAGMFAAKLSESPSFLIEKCYLSNVSVDGSSSASAGGFIGEISGAVTANDCAFHKADVGTSPVPSNSGAFAGKVTGVFNGNRLYVFGGKLSASSNAGGLIGYCDADPANLSLSGCKVTGAEVSATTGNAGGLAGYVKNQNVASIINSDTVVAGSIIKSNTGNAGGFVGSADSVLNISDSAYYMPGASDGTMIAGKVSREFAKVMGLSASTDQVEVSCDNLRSLAGFKYVNELKTGDISGMQWISGGTNVGGLVGVSGKNITVTNTFATGVLSALNGNAGGFTGNTSGNLTVTGSYADFYISGKRAGGFAAGCGAGSAFSSCYTAGFLVGEADIAAGFAPVDVGNITNSYTVFNFDNVADTSLFTGTAQEDDEHKLNENGTVVNYPDVQTHSFYPVAKSNSGKAYYAYSETDFEETGNAVCVTGQELADNRNEDGQTLLSGSFVKGQGRNNTMPYSLSPFFGSTLRDYPFPTLKVNKTVDGSSSETVLKHYNDWLIDGERKVDIEVWYMMYDENLRNLKTDVARVGRTGIKKYKDTKAVPVKTENGTEYQINVGAHEAFSGYKFVGYFDPVSAARPLTSSALFDRAVKFDYLISSDDELSNSIRRSMRAGDRVVQSSIATENTFGYLCADHSKVLEENAGSTYAKTKRIYAVYRFNKTYNVTLSHREYPLPTTVEPNVPSSFEKIYHGSKVITDDIYEVTYTESPDVYKLVYADKQEIRDKVLASHGKLSSDEEYTEDYIAEQTLRSFYPDDTTYNEKLSKLDNIRSGKETKINDSTTIAARSINQKIKKVPSLSKDDYELLNFDELVRKRIITSEYAKNARNKPVYSIVRIGPSKDAAGNQIAFNNRGFTEVKKDNNNNITMSTYKDFEYVILYYPMSVNRKLNFVFRNTDGDGTNNEVDSFVRLSEALEDSNYKNSGTHTVHVGYQGFNEIDGGINKLINNPPTFAGFTLDADASDSVFPSDKDEATLYYNRNRYAVSFRLKDDERYGSSAHRDPVQDIYYGDLYQQYLWEIQTSESEINFSGNYFSELQNASNIEIGHWESEFYYNNIRDWGWRDVWKCSYVADNYEKLREYVSGLSGNTGTFELRFNNRDEVYTWTKKDGSLSYKFNRKGYLLTGFKIYYQDESGEYKYQGTTSSIEKALYMPDRNVLVEPEWIINPDAIRVEIYYQSAYDDINASDKEKTYEFYKASTYDITNGEATGVVRRVGNRNETLNITNLIMNEDSKTSATYLDSFLRAGNFDKRKEHSPNETYPYLLNETNSLKYGYHHFITNDDDKDTIAVALYYDRAPVEYRFHFINNGNNVNSPYRGRYYTSNNRYTLFNIRNEWRDFTLNSSLYNYSGSDEYKTALSNELKNKTGNWVQVSKYAEAKCVTENAYAVDNTSIIYGGFNGNTYYYSNWNVATEDAVRYSVAIHYRALYGAPAVFDSDNTSLIPYWYCYMGGTQPRSLQRYVLGGSSSIMTTYFNDFSLQYFSDISADTSWQNKDLYPYYPDSNAGFTYFYVEVSAYDDPGFDPDRIRTSADEAVGFTNFKSDPTISSYGKSGNTVFINKEGIRKFIDGYTTYAVQYYDENGYFRTFYENDLPEYGGSYSRDMNIYLKRKTQSIQFVDAQLKSSSDFNTSYLYKQVIPRLPKGYPTEESELISPSSEYIFDGWYTNSNYDTKIADKEGNILDSYKVPPALVDGQGNLLMDYENMQVFAKWAPQKCRVVFNPFFPDIKDSSLNISLGEVDYETQITSFPEIVAPEGYDNRFIETEGEDLFYTIKTESGEIVRRYKFVGWYRYSGHGDPSDMSDLEVPFALNDTITDNTTLYAKWEVAYPGKAMYTITCIDYEKGEEIFSVQRAGLADTTITINPPKYTDAEHADNDIDIITGSYEALRKYEALTSPVETTLKDGAVYKFRYKKASSWEYTIRSCLNVNGTDILLSTLTEPTSYAQKLIAAPDIPGYSIYEYQIEDNAPVEKTDTSGYIALERPEDDSEALIITIRYHLADDGVTVKDDEAEYFMYDPIDFVAYEDGMFEWEDTDYVPGIVYTIGDDTVCAVIGDEEDIARVIKTISEKTPDAAYTVEMKLVAVSVSDGTSYLEVGDIGQTLVTIRKSANYLRFVSSTGSGDIYYAFAGQNAGNWYWDKELTGRIGLDGTTIATADISALPSAVKDRAQVVQDIITATYDEATDKYKAFIILKEDKAYVMVDNFGKLGNGALLTSDMTAFVEVNEDETGAVEIVLYDADGNESGTITVIIP